MSKINKFIIILIVFTIGIFCADTSINNLDIDIDDIKIVDFYTKNNKDFALAEKDLHVSINLLENGYDIFTCNGYGYRYGPSIMYYDDGSIDIWLASTGNNKNEWDYIRYIHSDDGIDWSEEKIVLRPTKNSLDHYSVCDPGVIYFNGYYYLGYTSTTNADGYANNAFVARSQNPDGPFEKWNGDGWGGDPYPIIEFNSDEKYWGIGELSFCIKEDTLYCYYTCYDAGGAYSKVATADLSENWPETLKYRGIAVERINNEDSLDVAYIEKYDKFLGLCVANRMSEKSYLEVFESDDGISFKKVEKINDNFISYSHNLGISKKADGSINSDDKLYIGYAYGNIGWGKWSTYLQEIELEVYLED